MTVHSSIERTDRYGSYIFLIYNNDKNFTFYFLPSYFVLFSFFFFYLFCSQLYCHHFLFIAFLLPYCVPSLLSSLSSLSYLPSYLFLISLSSFPQIPFFTPIYPRACPLSGPVHTMLGCKSKSWGKSLLPPIINST
jgi:hypothetical protein